MKFMLPVCCAGLFLTLALVGSPQMAAAAPGGPAKNRNQQTAKPTSDSSVSDAIRKSAADFIAAFNQGNAKALAAMWTTTGVYTDESGRRYTGRTEIAAAYTAFFKANPGIKLNLSISSIHVTSESSAVEEGTASVDPAPAGLPAMSRYTAVHVKQDGKWYMANVRDQRVELPSTYRHLQGLEWLAGDWSGEHAGAVAHISGRWIAQKSFLERTTTVTRGGKTISTSREIVGWDPLKQRITSWTFSTAGSRAEGVWTQQPNGGWFVESVGITSAGATSAALIAWQPLADGALGWHSESRSAPGQAVNDTFATVLKPIAK